MTSEKEKKEYDPPIIRRRTLFLNFFAVLIVVLIFAYVGAITFVNIPKENIRFADSALTFLLATCFYAIITWAFRSSKAQVDKENTEVEIQQINGKKKGGTNG